MSRLPVVLSSASQCLLARPSPSRCQLTSTPQAPAAAPFVQPKVLEPAASDTKSADETRVYSCPMHPEVSSERLGQCPKCGMNLVLVKPSATDAGIDTAPHRGHR